MNIFILDSDPTYAAIYQCDKHVVKMILESAQLLCSPFSESTSVPYKRTHYNHPCAIWTRKSLENYEWLLAHAYGLSDEYWRRYGKNHKSNTALHWCWNNYSSLSFKEKELTPFSQCMPEQYKVAGNAVQAYRNYYKGEKAKFAKWKIGNEPEWWKI